jgi:hypothetical protein
MGWTGTYRDPKMSTLDFFRREFSETVILDAGEDEDGTVYLARQRPGGEVHCIICITEWETNDRYFNFNYKDMFECEGPFAAKCPENVFELLSSPEKLYTGMMLERSRKWREDVKQQNLW